MKSKTKQFITIFLIFVSLWCSLDAVMQKGQSIKIDTFNIFESFFLVNALIVRHTVDFYTPF